MILFSYGFRPFFLFAGLFAALAAPASSVFYFGGDLVEISPPHDTSGNTAMLGADLFYEMLCGLPGVACRE